MRASAEEFDWAAEITGGKFMNQRIARACQSIRFHTKSCRRSPPRMRFWLALSPGLQYAMPHYPVQVSSGFSVSTSHLLPGAKRPRSFHRSVFEQYTPAGIGRYSELFFR